MCVQTGKHNSPTFPLEHQLDTTQVFVVPLRNKLVSVLCTIHRHHHHQACGRGGRWERAITLMDDMRREGLDPDGLTYRRE